MNQKYDFNFFHCFLYLLVFIFLCSSCAHMDLSVLMIALRLKHDILLYIFRSFTAKSVWSVGECCSFIVDSEVKRSLLSSSLTQSTDNSSQPHYVPGRRELSCRCKWEHCWKNWLLCSSSSLHKHTQLNCAWMFCSVFKLIRANTCVHVVSVCTST